MADISHQVTDYGVTCFIYDMHMLCFDWLSCFELIFLFFFGNIILQIQAA